jgi:hypothetical protein
MTSAKDFFNQIDLSKLDTATSSLIREDILTLSDNDWDLIDSDSEMQKQMEIIKERLETEFPTSISAEPKEEKKEVEQNEELKAKLVSDIEEMQMLIELTQDTLKENPNDEDLPMYLELLNDTLQGIMANQMELLKK